MNIRFYLKRPNDDRVTNIYALLNYNLSQFKYYLIEKIHPDDWSATTQKAKKGARYTSTMEFNQRLLMRFIITRIYIVVNNQHQRFSNKSWMMYLISRVRLA
jgi:hypothetical protein